MEKKKYIKYKKLGTRFPITADNPFADPSCTNTL